MVKLLVGRPKDLELLHALLDLRVLDLQRLRAHYQRTPLGDTEAATAGRNLHWLAQGTAQASPSAPSP